MAEETVEAVEVAPAAEVTESQPAETGTSTEAAAAGGEEAQPAELKSGPPETIPYGRFQRENQEKRAAQARSAALEAELARRDAAPAKARDPEQDYIAEAVRPLMEPMLREVEDMKLSRDVERFWSEKPEVDPNVKTLANDLLALAKDKARSEGTPMRFNLNDFLIYASGMRAEESRLDGIQRAGTQRQAAQAQRAQLDQVKQIARVEGGSQTAKPGPKKIEEMTASEMEKFYGNVPI